MRERRRHVLLVCGRENRHARWKTDLEAAGYEATVMHNASDLLVFVHENRIDAVLISDDVSDWQSLARELKGTPWFAGLPLLLLLESDEGPRLDELRSIPFDDYLVSRGESTGRELLLRLFLRETRLAAYIHSNPLTHLPGNLMIGSAIENAIDGKDDFAVCYVDIDNFKAFNDSYGFSAGDDLIRMTARVIENVVRRHAGPGGFVGHIGGDDFVFLVPSEPAVRCCDGIINDFEKVSRVLYREEDLTTMTIVVENRHGEKERFPLPTLSIAGVDSRQYRPRHTGEVALLTAGLKKRLKQMTGSHYLFAEKAIT